RLATATLADQRQRFAGSYEKADVVYRSNLPNDPAQESALDRKVLFQAPDFEQGVLANVGAVRHTGSNSRAECLRLARVAAPAGHRYRACNSGSAGEMGNPAAGCTDAERTRRSSAAWHAARNGRWE